MDTSNMSTDLELDAEVTCIRASGGSNRVDNINLGHEEECKKRLTQSRGRDLFTQPDESHWGECPICCLPLPIDLKKSTLSTCCSKRICDGCDVANQKSEVAAGLERRCAFCREPLANSQEEAEKRMKRIKKNDPAVMCHMGASSFHEGDYESALKYWTKAAEFGDAEAHYRLSIMYRKGLGVEEDMEKENHHLEEAAMGGHPDARYNLGCEDANNGRFEGAKNHFIIAANLGDHESLKAVEHLHADGYASKEDYANALRSYQSAVAATKSEEREVAEEVKNEGVLFF
jgi:hypothetical protein